MEEAPEACKFQVEDSNEAQHARELLVMEEEARIRRRNLMKRINFEHCVQQKERQDLIEKIDQDIRELERRLQNEAYHLELELRSIEARTEVLEENTVNRTAHLQQCHDNQVDRLKEYMGRLETKLDDIASRQPEVEKELKELQSPPKTETEVALKEMEDQLKVVRNRGRDVRRQVFDEEQTLKMDFDGLINEDDIDDIENDLRSTQADARNLRHEEEEELASINYDIHLIKKKIEKVHAEGVDDLEDKLHKDIAGMNTDLEEEEKTLSNLKSESKDMKTHFNNKFAANLTAQNNRITGTRKDLQKRMDIVVGRLKDADEEKKKIPDALDHQVKQKKANLADRMKRLQEREANLETKYKNDLVTLQGNQGEQLDQMKDRLVALGTQEKQMIDRHEKLKDQLEQNIDNKTNSIPDLLNTIDKVDKQFLDVISNKHGDLGKTEMIHKMVKLTNESGVTQICTELDNMDQLVAKSKQDYDNDIARKEEELQEMLNKHRVVRTDFDFIDRKVRIATRDLRNDTNHTKYKMRCLRAIIRDQNTVLANLDGTTARTEHEMEEMIKRAANAHVEEKERLQNLLGDERNSQFLACDQLKEAIEHASGKHDDMVKSHRELRDGLIKKLSEKQKIIDTKFDLEQVINKMGTKIKDLDNKMNAMADKHGVTMADMEKLHAQYKNNLSGRKAVQLFRVEQQKKLNTQVSHMENMLDSVNRGLEAVNHEAVMADTEEAEDLKRRLASLTHQNNMLIFKVRQLGKNKDQLTNLLGQLATQEDTPAATLLKLQSLHTSLQNDLSGIRHDLQKAKADKIAKRTSGSSSILDKLLRH